VERNCEAHNFVFLLFFEFDHPSSIDPHEKSNLFVIMRVVLLLVQVVFCGFRSGRCMVGVVELDVFLKMHVGVIRMICGDFFLFYAMNV